MAIDKDGVRAEFRGSTQRHGRVHTELARFIRSGGDHSALMALAANDHGLAFERRIVKFFHRNEERVHIHVEDSAGESRHVGCDGHERIVAGMLITVDLSGQAWGSKLEYGTVTWIV